MLRLLVGIIALAGGVANAAGCSDPVGKDFPSIPTLASKLSPATLLKFNQDIDRGGFDALSLLVLQGCQLVFERYKTGVNRDDTHFLYGGTIIITGALVGKLIQDGRIKSLDAPLASLIKRPMFVADENWEKLNKIRLIDAMRQRSGFEWKRDPKLGYYPVHSESADMLRDGVKLPLEQDPGTDYKHDYSDFDAALVGFAISDAIGKDLPQAAQSLLFEPMQIPSSEWVFKDRMGKFSGGVGARMRPMDMLKIGQLYLQGGLWNGMQLLGQDFVKAAMPLTGPYESGFGLMWVNGKNPDLGDSRFFFVGGRKTQRLYVFPDWDMVVVLTASVAPEDDQKIVRPLVVALKAALQRGANEEGASNELEKLVKMGFNGSRTIAEPWDKPK